MFSPAPLVGPNEPLPWFTLMPLLTLWPFGNSDLPRLTGLNLLLGAPRLLVGCLGVFFSLSMCGYLRHGWNKETYTLSPSWRLALLGVTVGLACLSKYHGFVLGSLLGSGGVLFDLFSLSQGLDVAMDPRRPTGSSSITLFPPLLVLGTASTTGFRFGSSSLWVRW